MAQGLHRINMFIVIKVSWVSSDFSVELYHLIQNWQVHRWWIRWLWSFLQGYGLFGNWLVSESSSSLKMSNNRFLSVSSSCKVYMQLNIFLLYTVSIVNANSEVMADSKRPGSKSQVLQTTSKDSSEHLDVTSRVQIPITPSIYTHSLVPRILISLTYIRSLSLSMSVSEFL